MKNVIVKCSTVCHHGDGVECIVPIEIHSVKCPALPLSDTELHQSITFNYAVWAETRETHCGSISTCVVPTN